MSVAASLYSFIAVLISLRADFVYLDHLRIHRMDTRDYYSTVLFHTASTVPSPLATNSDTASYATAQASSIPSECSTAGSTSLRDEYGGATAGQPVAAYNTASTSRMVSHYPLII